MTRRTDRGFSLVELIAVAALIGIISAIAIPLTLSQRGTGIKAGQNADLLILAQEAQAHLEETGYDPQGTSGDATLEFSNTGQTWQLWPAGELRTTPLRTGNLTQPGQTITGGIYLDGTYCIASTHPTGSTYALRSSTGRPVENSTCPTAPNAPTSGTTTADGRPGPLVGFTAVGGTAAATFTWTAAPGADAKKWVIEGYAAGGGSGGTPTTPINVQGLPAGTHTIKAWGVNSAGNGPISTVTVTVRPMPDSSTTRPVWLPLELKNGWRNQALVDMSDRYYEASYTMSGGIVKVQGVLDSATATVAAGTVIATLPVGYRPDYDMRFQARSMTAAGSVTFGSVDVQQDGDIALTAALTAGLDFSLDSIVFPAAGVADWTAFTDADSGATITGGWTDPAGSQWGPARYWIDPDNLLWMAGRITGGTTTGGTTILDYGSSLTLPPQLFRAAGGSMTTTGGTVRINSVSGIAADQFHLGGIVLRTSLDTLDWHTPTAPYSAQWTVNASYDQPRWTKTSYGLVVVSGTWTSGASPANTTGVRVSVPHCPRRNLALVSVAGTFARSMEITGIEGTDSITLNGAALTPNPTNCGHMFLSSAAASQATSFHAVYFGDL